MTASELWQRYAAGGLLFKQADLRGVALSYADLRRICLCGADLTGAKLVNTNLDDADLHFAHPTGSNRQGWTPEGANLGTASPRSPCVPPGPARIRLAPIPPLSRNT